jgi:DNA-binding transcriptional LysR family regulator
VETRRLKAFVALVEHGGFQQAANQLRVTQSALSQQVGKLETELNAKLVDRSTRPIQVTSLGWEVYYEARRVLEALAAVSELGSPAGQLRYAKLRVGVVPAMMFDRPARLIRSFNAEPDLPEVTVRATATSELIDDLEHGLLDAAILLTAPTVDGVEALQLFEEDYQVCMPDDHRLVTRNRVNFSELRNEQILHSPRAVNVHGYDSVVAACMKSGFSPTIVEATGSYMDQAAYVSAGLGVAFVPTSLAALRPAGVEYRELQNPRVTMRVYACWRANSVSSNAKKFIEYLAQRCKDDMLLSPPIEA